MILSPGMKVANYEILGVLGSGGMGQVYRARDIQLGRLAAIKFLTEESANDDRLRRFFTEAKAASALNHPNILTVYGIGEHENNPYIAMEYVDGQTLRSIIQQGALPLNRALDITVQTLAGLSKAHSIGIVHRDLKPENIMITQDGFVKILDFGLAKLLTDESFAGTGSSLPTMDSPVTKTGMIMGTTAYMSPEQARGQNADLRSDLFSLGIVLYEMLTGINPFRRATTVDTISAILRDVPPPLVPTVKVVMPGLSALLDKTLQKEPERRFASAREMEQAIHDLRRQLNSKELYETVEYSSVIPSTQPSEKYTPKSSINLRLAAGAIALLVIAVTVVFFSHKNTRPTVSGSPVIAVMAFENKTADPELAKADIGRVLSDAFVQVLYDCKGVQVISPWRINGAAVELGRSFSDTARDLKLIEKLNENLNANIILSGSLSQIENSFI